MNLYEPIILIVDDSPIDLKVTTLTQVRQDHAKTRLKIDKICPLPTLTN